MASVDSKGAGPTVSTGGPQTVPVTGGGPDVAQAVDRLQPGAGTGPNGSPDTVHISGDDGDGTTHPIVAAIKKDKPKSDADAIAKAQAEKKAAEEKNDAALRAQKEKELQDQIKETQAQLQQASQNGDKDQVKALSAHLEDLQSQLKDLQSQDAPPSTPPSSAAPSSAGVSPASAPSGPQGGAPSPSSMPSSPGGAPMSPSACGPPSEGLGCVPTPPSPTSPAPQGQITPNGSGQDAVDLAKKYLNYNAADIKGALPNFTAAGGQTNDCADFVSSVLEDTGRIRGHHTGVSDLQQSLVSQGYRPVSKDQAQPGDVWISNGAQHTELVATAGATQLIGSNNDRPGHQVISTNGGPSSGTYYHLGS